MEDFSLLILDLFLVHGFLLLLILASVVIEKITGLSLFVDQFRWKKSPNNALNIKARDTVYYIIYMVACFVYFLVKGKLPHVALAIPGWIFTMVIAVIYQRKFYDRYQGVDPSKSDDDYYIE
jgi:hypothetical protein